MMSLELMLREFNVPSKPNKMEPAFDSLMPKLVHPSRISSSGSMGAMR